MKRELTLEDIKFQHLLRKIPSASKNAPVTGFYHLLKPLSGNYTGEAARYNSYLFEAYYHPNQPDFSQGFKVPVMIWSFYNNGSIGPKECELIELEGAVINLSEFGPHINVFIDETTGDETEWTSYKAVWEIVAFSNPSQVSDLSALYPADEAGVDEEYEDLALDADFEDELEAMLFGADIEIIDEESELVFWEANQANFCVSDIELEVLLDKLEIESVQANMQK